MFTCDSRLISLLKDSNKKCQKKKTIIYFIMELKVKDYILDGFFKVNNENGIEEYSPVMNPDEFKECQKHIIE